METLQRALEPYKHFDPPGWINLFRFLPVWAGALTALIGVGLLLRGGGVLITLLVLPLYVPVLIFGAGAVEATAGGISPQGHLLLLGAISLGAAVLAPWAIAAALRISME